MKPQEEIEQIAESAYPIKDDMYADLWSENNAYKKGYTQCQEDMADKKYTEEDMRQAIFTSFLLGVDRGNYSKELEDKLIDNFNKETI